MRSWADDFKTALLARFDEAYALQLFATYAQAFPAAYTEDFPGDAAAHDVTFLEAAEKEPQRLHLDIYRAETRRKDKLFSEDLPRPGCHPDLRSAAHAREHGAQGHRRAPVRAGILGRAPRLDSGSRTGHSGTASKQLRSPRGEIKSAFTAVWTGRMDNDSFNRLTLAAGVPWRMVTVLRAYCRYLLQTGLPFSQGYIAQVLANNPVAARHLADLFVARFDPELVRRGARARRSRGSNS